MQGRFDKYGNRLPETGHGCGCRLCAASNARRYERRREPRQDDDLWSSWRRRIVRTFKALGAKHPQAT